MRDGRPRPDACGRAGDRPSHLLGGAAERGGGMRRLAGGGAPKVRVSRAEVGRKLPPLQSGLDDANAATLCMQDPSASQPPSR